MTSFDALQNCASISNSKYAFISTKLALLRSCPLSFSINGLSAAIAVLASASVGGWSTSENFLSQSAIVEAALSPPLDDAASGFVVGFDVPGLPSDCTGGALPPACLVSVWGAAAFPRSAGGAPASLLPGAAV